MRNPKKFGSPKLEIYNSTYDFSNFASISAHNWAPRFSRARVSSAQGRAPVLTSYSSLMVSSPMTAPAPLDSSQLSARNGVDGWGRLRESRAMALLMAPRRIGNNSGPPELARMVKLGFCQASTPYGEPGALTRMVNGGRGGPATCGVARR